MKCPNCNSTETQRSLLCGGQFIHPEDDNRGSWNKFNYIVHICLKCGIIFADLKPSKE